MTLMNFSIAALGALVLMMAGPLAAQEDRHAGYYYPEPQITEKYTPRVAMAPGATPVSRISFSVGITAGQNKRPHAPPFHLFVKGGKKEKLIIVATEAGRYDTVYRLRALLASMTSQIRTTSVFRKAPNPETLTFLDFCYRLGFERVTVTDGDKIAIQINLK